MKIVFKNRLSWVMSQAWQLMRAGGVSRSEAMRQSWLLWQLDDALQRGSVKFFYQKKNGDIRFACGTLIGELIPQPSVERSERKVNNDVMVYYDRSVQAFRSFKKMNLIKIA